ASKINPETGRAYNLWGDQLKLSKWAQAYEMEHGGVVPEGSCCLPHQSCPKPKTKQLFWQA
ncbi:MAG: hypothetical protein ABSE62_13375, partial [Chthoniobacteraceae bacterium]